MAFISEESVYQYSDCYTRVWTAGWGSGNMRTLFSKHRTHVSITIFFWIQSQPPLLKLIKYVHDL